MWTQAPLSLPEGVAWGFSSRTQGDLGDGDFSTPAQKRLAWARACAALGEGASASQVALLRQVHGARVVEVDAPAGIEAPVAEADGLWTSRTGVILAIRVADCAPVLLASRLAVGAAHAGWRGAAAGVVPATLHAMCEGAKLDPSDVVACIGPCLSQAAFEVGPEVVDALAETVPSIDGLVAAGQGDRAFIDLAGVIARQLMQAGVARVHTSEICSRNPGWYSWRRDRGQTGRQAGLVWRRPSG